MTNIMPFFFKWQTKENKRVGTESQKTTNHFYIQEQAAGSSDSSKFFSGT
jgi:hypothetical protein